MLQESLCSDSSVHLLQIPEPELNLACQLFLSRSKVEYCYGLQVWYGMEDIPLSYRVSVHGRLLTVINALCSAWGKKVSELQFRDRGAPNWIQSRLKTCFIFTESQNGQGDLWASSDPTYLLKQGHLEQLSQEHVQRDF